MTPRRLVEITRDALLGCGDSLRAGSVFSVAAFVSSGPGSGIVAVLEAERVTLKKIKGPPDYDSEDIEVPPGSIFQMGIEWLRFVRG